jgi:hypothetical protein
MSEVKPEPKKHKNPIMAAIGIPFFGIGYLYLRCYVRFVIFLVVLFGFDLFMAVLGVRNVPAIIRPLITVGFMLDAYTVAVKQNGEEDEMIMF